VHSKPCDHRKLFLQFLHHVLCARAANDQAVAEATTTLMKSRRRIACSNAQEYANNELHQGFVIGEMGCKPPGFPMGFEVPTPTMTFDVALNDGAQIRMRRHGNPDGVRLLVTHGDGFAADAYFPYWQHLLPRFDVLVFDFRNHGQNILVVPPHHTYEQLTRDLERVVRAVKSRFGEKRTAGLFHSMSARTAMKHAIEVGWCWDALVLFDPPQCATAWAPTLRSDGGLREWVDRVGTPASPALCLDRRTDAGVFAVAGHGALGRRRARVDGATTQQIAATRSPRRRGRAAAAGK